MAGEQTYRGMTISSGVKHVESHYSLSTLGKITEFADLHEIRDANLTLPFNNDVGRVAWLKFANAVIAQFDADRRKE